MQIKLDCSAAVNKKVTAKNGRYFINEREKEREWEKVFPNVVPTSFKIFSLCSQIRSPNLQEQCAKIPADPIGSGKRKREKERGKKKENNSCLIISKLSSDSPDTSRTTER